MTETGIATAAAEFAQEPDAQHEAEPLLLGHSRAFSRLREGLARVTGGEAPVLLSGESGAGRAILARAIHRASGRAVAPFVVVSCADVPETVLETELFGCVKGAVVGASSERHGVLDMAHGGSVYLADIDQMSARTQSLLVSFLESGEVQKVGALGPGIPADVRLLASLTVKGGRSRTQAHGRLCPELRAQFIGSELAIPALRERRDDIPVLADYFARATAARLGLPAATFTPQAHSALQAYSWPGNVHELRQVVERVVADAPCREIRAENLPVGIRPRLILAARGSAARRSVAEDLLARLVTGGESFWTAVYPLFMRREITRMDVRELVRRGRALASGCQEGLVQLFNMPAKDRGRFERFLRRYQCEGFAMVRARGSVAVMDDSGRGLFPRRRRVSGPGANS